MPPLYRPGPRTGKQPPHVMPRGMGAGFDPGDGGWPPLLHIPTDAGLMLPCGMFHPLECVNDDSFEGLAPPGR
jgi:hypothetical protein